MSNRIKLLNKLMETERLHKIAQQTTVDGEIDKTTADQLADKVFDQLFQEMVQEIGSETD
jgi:hypothetical protein